MCGFSSIHLSENLFLKVYSRSILATPRCLHGRCRATERIQQRGNVAATVDAIAGIGVLRVLTELRRPVILGTLGLLDPQDVTPMTVMVDAVPSTAPRSGPRRET